MIVHSNIKKMNNLYKSTKKQRKKKRKEIMRKHGGKVKYY